MLGTTLQEQEKRRKEYNHFKRRFDQLITLAKEDDSILGSQEYDDLCNILSFGPTYDYLLADIRNPDYFDAFGNHPLSYKPIREEYNLGIYGKKVCFEGRDMGKAS